MSLYCLTNARSAEQLSEMQRLEADGICLFCPDGLRSHGRQKVLWRTRHWSVTPNEFPYAGARHHLLLVPDEHVTDMIDLSEEAQRDFWTVLAEVRQRYDLTYYGLGVRNGDCRFTGGTIRHVHAHVLVGGGDQDEHVPVRMRFSSRPTRRTTF